MNFLGSTRASPPYFVDMVAIWKEWFGMEERSVRAEKTVVVVPLEVSGDFAPPREEAPRQAVKVGCGDI